MMLVSDDEHVLRSIKDEAQYFACDAQGNLTRLSSSAFNDRSMQPSVDRVCLRAHPSESKKSPGDGVVTLHVAAVRGIKNVLTNDSKGNPQVSHEVDVHHDPLADNIAHALVKADPGISGQSTFRRLKEALSLIAQREGWILRPTSLGG